MIDPDLVSRGSRFRPWDAMAPAALFAILKRGPFRSSAETGCGGSTIILSQISERHTAFALEGEDRTISSLSAHGDLRLEAVRFVEGETRMTLPLHQFEEPIDMALLDGPHAYPLPQLEFVYLFPWLRVGGWLVIDDLQIPSVNELFEFLRNEPSMKLEEIVVRTAFFRRVARRETGPDGWTLQGMNRRLVLRYSWRDQVRKALGLFVP